MTHDATDLERLFASCFFDRYRTLLVGGGTEPLYTPATTEEPAVLRYREDFFASALHEVAHWCIAGPARRERVDLGYWYAPDGRTEAQQRAFEAVEVAPQALEWAFSDACGFSFKVSADNVEAGMDAGQEFQRAVQARRKVLTEQGSKGRPGLFLSALTAFYRAP